MLKKLLTIDYSDIVQVNQNQYPTTIHHSLLNAPIIQISLDGTIETMNQVVERMTGYSKDMMIGQSIFCLLQREKHHEFLERLSACQIGIIDIYHSEFTHINKEHYSFHAYTIPVMKANVTVAWQFVIFDYQLQTMTNHINPIPYTHIVDTLHLSMWSFDYKSKMLTYASPNIEELFGRSIKEILQSPVQIWNQSIHPEDHLIVTENYKKLIDGHQIIQQFRLIHPDGSICWVETQISPYISEEGSIQYLYGMMTDVTDKKDIEQRLIEKGQLYQSFFESNTDAVMVFDTKGRFIAVNDAFTALSGYTISELDEPFMQLVQKKDREWTWDTFIQSVHGEQTSFDLEVLRKDGARIKVAIINQPINIDGEITGIFAIAKDLTDLNESEEKYRTVVENAPVGVWIVHNEVIQFMNSFLQEKLGVHNSQKGKLKHQFIYRKDRDKVREKIKNLLANHAKSAVYTYRMITEDQQLIYVEACGTLIYYEGTPAVLETILDVTERKIMENIMMKKERELELSERRHKALVENAYDAISIRDEHGYITYTSPAFNTLFGYPSEANKDINDLKLIHPNDADMIKLKFKACLSDPSKKIRCEIRIKHANGKWIYVEIIMTNQLCDPSINGIIINYRDVTDRVEARERIRNLAFFDSLTNTPNRQYFEDALKREIDLSKGKDQQLSLMFLDLDKFKYVNDTLGHRIGDLLLKEVANRLLSCLLSTDMLARLGGDEFVILSTDSSLDKVNLFVQQVLKKFKETFVIESYDLNMTVSIGVSLYPDSGADADSLMRCADMAMYQAKEQGKNQYFIYTPYMNAVALKSFTLANDLHKSIAMKQLYLMYQPIVNTTTNKIVTVEALVRWNHPTWGDVSPIEFISLAEESGFITEMGNWVLYEACRQLKQWHDFGYDSLGISVNFSTLQFLEQHLIDKIVQIFVKTDFNPKWLTIEITENTLMKNDDQVMRTIRQLKEMGIRFAIDDFGTGFSSLSYLKNYRMDILKIDKSFIDDITIENDSFEIVSTVVDLAKKLKMDIVAEGIETVDQLNKIKSTSCEKVQGYLYSKPLKARDLGELLKKGSHISYQPLLNRQSINNTRQYSRIVFENPVEAEMTITRLAGNDVNVGDTKILIENIGAGGLKFTTNVSFSTQSDIVLSFTFKLFDLIINFKGQIVWKMDVDDGIYQYGVDFLLDSREHEQLNEKMHAIHLSLRKDNIGFASYFIKDDINNYSSHVSY